MSCHSRAVLYYRSSNYGKASAHGRAAAAASDADAVENNGGRGYTRCNVMSLNCC